MSDKKPAHEVIVEMIGEVIRALSKDEDADELRVAAQMGILSAELEILKRMIILEKHREDVVKDLHQIKTDCLLDNVDRLLTDKLFLTIATPKNTNKA
ncbi:MAG: hypothetical protein U9R14_04975 [Patescibacteria group bacterium]|nr:hypothetical protein [Patescibacteria group bacterium]